MTLPDAEFTTSPPAPILLTPRFVAVSFVSVAPSASFGRSCVRSQSETDTVIVLIAPLK